MVIYCHYHNKTVFNFLLNFRIKYRPNLDYGQCLTQQQYNEYTTVTGV